MGYYTSYSLSWTDKDGDVYDSPFNFETLTCRYLSRLPEEARAVLEALTQLSDAKYALSGNQTKWYDYEKDMLALSSLFPLLPFTLHGEGEEQGDVWERVYLGGKLTKRRKAQVVMVDV